MTRGCGFLTGFVYFLSIRLFLFRTLSIFVMLDNVQLTYLIIFHKCSISVSQPH